MEGDYKIRLHSLGKETKRHLAKKGKQEPEIQGYFQVDSRTMLGIPANITDVEAWKQRMLEKYTDYDKKNNIKLLSGMAKQLLKP